MLKLDIPGSGEVNVSRLVCDFNGTLACDGSVVDGVAERFRKLAASVEIHVVTADTFGAARDALAGLPCKVEILPPGQQDASKLELVRSLGVSDTVCIGNGRNDRLMLKAAVLGIALVQEEGAAVETLVNADVVCQSIRDALDLLLQPKRLKATLRI